MTDIEKEIEQKNNEIDFSQYVGRYKDTLVIKGNNYLKSFKNWEIDYNNEYSDMFIDDINYKEGKMENLKVWDIFIYKSELENIQLDKFNIFMWKKHDWNYVVQYLSQSEWIEYRRVSNFDWSNNQEIIIFNRF